MPIITLCSDMSPADYQLGAIRGVLMQCDPSFQLVDLAHDIVAFQTSVAAYIVRGAARYYPSNTTHIVLVDVHANRPVRWLLTQFRNQYVVCPDNGLISHLMPNDLIQPIEISIPREHDFNTIEYLAFVGETLHSLYQGTAWEKLGSPAWDFDRREPYQAIMVDNWVKVTVLHIDTFENVIVNITQEEFEQLRAGRDFQIQLHAHNIITKISQHYTDVPPGEKLALFNSAGYLEIAINRGNAASLLGLNPPKSGQLDASTRYLNTRAYYHEIKIAFIDHHDSTTKLA